MPENGFTSVLNPDDFKDDDKLDNLDENSNDDGKSNEDDSNKSNEDKSKTDENSDENAKTQEELEAEKKRKELHEKNEQEKAKRLAREQKEREEKIRKDAKLEAELGLIKTNEFTGEKITDEEDLEIYKIMKEIDEKGGDALNDLPKVLAERNRKAKEEAKKAEEDRVKNEKSIVDEVNGFHERHKDITKEYLVKIGFDKVVDNPEYNGWSYAERVNDYLNKYNSAKKESDEKNKNIDDASKRMTKVPSSNSGPGKTKAVKDYDPNIPEDKEAFKEYWRNKYGE